MNGSARGSVATGKRSQETGPIAKSPDRISIRADEGGGGGGDRGCGGVVSLVYPGSGNRCKCFGGGCERVVVGRAFRGRTNVCGKKTSRRGRRTGRGRGLCTVGVVRRTGRTGPVHVNKPPARSIPKGNKRASFDSFILHTVRDFAYPLVVSRHYHPVLSRAPPHYTPVTVHPHGKNAR